MRGLRRGRSNGLKSYGNRGSPIWQPERPAPPLRDRTAHPTTSTPPSSLSRHSSCIASSYRSIFHFSSCVAFLAGTLWPASSSDWTGVALGLGIIPDCDERQDSDKNRDQTKRPPMSMLVFHILLLGLGAWAETAEPLTRGRCFLFTFRVRWLFCYLQTRSTMSPFSWE